ncbi:acyltransferase family protein [Granulicella arctica]|uniref:Peptidoglycan/LPS O-acetylase OafA/YrhL n=1 Tax=Granulicella arctica TaxID=940613 RepID=A0A7Y9PGU5_9BACT|nr:acyltransferase [Granulicella arctica]NYF79592.1 peptidoglycan/LPS O-acetylase OafA/YrhL [Granulicella arctica]
MPKIQTLQSLRAIAALLVVFDHTSLPSAGHGLSARVPYFASFIGMQGVAIFFIISGFIMTYTANSPDDAAPRASLAKNFAIRRIVRVVPLYWFFTLLAAGGILLAGLGKLMPVSYVLKSLFFIPYVGKFGPLLLMLPIVPMGWTLNYEMVFYALFTAALLLPYRFRIPALVATLAAIVTIGAGFYPLLSGTSPHSEGEFLTRPIILLFGVGAALGWLRLKRPDFTLKVVGLPWVVPLLAINAIIANPRTETFPLRSNAIYWLIDLAIVALCIFGRPVRLSWLETLGNASYSLYLVHLIPVAVCYILWKLLHFPAPIVFTVVCLVVSAATSLATYRWLERPLTRTFARLLERPRTRAITIAAPVLEPALEPITEPVVTTELFSPGI